MPLTRLADFHPADGAHRRVRLMAVLLTGRAGGPSAPLEWLYGCLKVSWGLWLLLPTHTFASSPHLYAWVAAVAPEWAWGLVWLSTGAAQLLCWYRDWRRGRFVSNVLGACLWLGYGALMFCADARSSALAFMGPLAAFQVLAAAWLYPQAARGGLLERTAQERTAPGGDADDVRE